MRYICIDIHIYLNIYTIRDSLWRLESVGAVLRVRCVTFYEKKMNKRKKILAGDAR